jgi:type VI secretion system protein ImpL
MSWPGDALNGASHLAWRTEKSGLRADLHADGRFGLIRLLSQAQVTQLDGARYVLSWKSESDDPQAVALRILLRSEAGGGPLDVLALRNFVLPQQIFLAPRAAAESVQMRKEIPGRQSLSL